jgi:hypothetical protein
MRFFSLLIVTCVAAGIACAKDTRPQAPQISCDTPVFDFGSIPAGQNVTHVFTVRNTGRELLHIQRAQGS